LQGADALRGKAGHAQAGDRVPGPGGCGRRGDRAWAQLVLQDEQPSRHAHCRDLPGRQRGQHRILGRVRGGRALVLRNWEPRRMKVIVACEFSGIVRDAFIAAGHEAVSCDLLESERPGPHIEGDIRDVDLTEFDLLVAHPPCTNLAVSGARWFKEKKREQEQDLSLIQRLLDAPVSMIALENPVSIISSRIRPPDQIIQPWQFGEDASKATCLWLKNLPLLQSTRVLPGGRQARRANQTPSGQNKLGPSPMRARDRAVTYRGIAEAMATQWGDPLFALRRAA